MARRSGKKMSRRELIVVLGAGALAGGMTAPAEAANCVAVTPHVGDNPITPGGKGKMLMVDPCCSDSAQLVLRSFDSRPLTAGAKEHLKTLHDQVNSLTASGDLLEYSLMIWGLKEDQRADLVSNLREKYRLAPYAAPRKPRG